MKYLAFILYCSTAFNVCYTSLVNKCLNLNPMKSLDANEIEGAWYEVATYGKVDNNCTRDYIINDKANLSIAAYTLFLK